MAAETDLTTLSTQVDPEVLAPIVSYELKNSLRFAALAQIDETLKDRPGSEITFPSFEYIGDAKDVGEGESIPFSKLTTSTTKVTIKKAAKGVHISDEAMLSGYGDPVGEAASQLAKSLANKVDNDILEAALKGTQHVAFAATVEGVQAALDTFNDEEDGVVVGVFNPSDASSLRMDAIKNNAGTEVGANALIKGTYYDVLGVQIQRSRKMPKGTGVLVKISSDEVDKLPAFKVVLKRDTQIETARDIYKKSTEMTGDKHYGVYLFNESKVVRMGDTPTAPIETPADTANETETPQEA